MSAQRTGQHQRALHKSWWNAKIADRGRPKARAQKERHDLLNMPHHRRDREQDRCQKVRFAGMIQLKDSKTQKDSGEVVLER